MSTETLLDAWVVEHSEHAPTPVLTAATLLEGLGATVLHGRGDAAELRLRGPALTTSARLDDWSGEDALRSALEELGEPALAPTGFVLTAYAAQRLACAALAGEPRIATTTLVDELLRARAVRGRIKPELIPCADGWGVARFRDQDERDLFHALAGPEGTARVEDVLAETRVARLLFAAVRPPRRGSPFGAGGSLDGAPAPARLTKVIDWTVLWAGPWATAQLGVSGAVVERIEHPRRRDGLLNSPAGRDWWGELNGSKSLVLLDGSDHADRAAIRSRVEDASILVTSMTPRALASLGIDDVWRLERAPSLLHLELVAFDEPWSELPGLGEHASATAGLLWREGQAPATPYSWADPLLGAGAVTFARAWLASDGRRGGRIRLSLEQAASSAFTQSASAPVSTPTV